MGTTFIDYKDNNKGFYIHESYFQLACIYIYMELQKPGLYNGFTNKADFIADLEIVANGFRSGYLVLAWDEYLANENDEQLMIQLLQNIIGDLQDKGKYISVEEQQALPTTDAHLKRIMNTPFPTSELVRIFNALIEILRGTWDSANYNMEIKY